MKNIATPPELFKVFALEESAPQKVAKAPGGAAGAGAPAATGGGGGAEPAGGNVFKI